MTKHTIPPLDARTRRQSVTETLRKLIIDGELPPGEQVNQVLIAEQLGVSRGPLREALAQLEEEGLIKNVPYKGTFVTTISGEYIAELYSIRRVLEIFAVQQAAEHASSEDIAALRAILAQMYTAAEADDITRMSDLDIQFHTLIFRSAHHTMLLQLWKSLEMGVRRCLVLRHRIYQSPRDVIGTHPDILAAIEAHDGEQAGHIIEAHIREAGELLYQSWSRVQQDKEEP